MLNKHLSNESQNLNSIAEGDRRYDLQLCSLDSENLMQFAQGLFEVYQRAWCLKLGKYVTESVVALKVSI